MLSFSFLAAATCASLLLSSCSISPSALSHYVQAIPSIQPSLSTASLAKLHEVDHIIVLYMENQSYDFIFSQFPNSDGLSASTLANLKPQLDKSGNVYTYLPRDTPSHSLPPNLPNAPFLGSLYIPSNTTTPFDITHRYYEEQYEIDNCNMDRYAAWSSDAAGGWAMAHYDLSHDYVGQLASNWTLFDRFHHSAFGGSFLNHQYLIAAQAPKWLNAPTSQVTRLDSIGYINGSSLVCTTDSYAVNTVYSVNKPINPSTKPADRLPSLHLTTIGDSLSSANVSWVWYSELWDTALAVQQNPSASTKYFSDNFQYHHQPFIYFDRFSDPTSADSQKHLQDENKFFSALVSGKGLPAVSFVKPAADDDWHPSQNNPFVAQMKLKHYIDTVQNSTYWNKTLVVITFDENGGLYDHVCPWIGDRWGPGSRVPTIAVSPLLPASQIKKVNNHPYETLSILKLIQTRFNLSNLISADRDVTVRDLAHIFEEDVTATVVVPTQLTGPPLPAPLTGVPVTPVPTCANPKFVSPACSGANPQMEVGLVTLVGTLCVSLSLAVMQI